jgi:hypothetical protein
MKQGFLLSIIVTTSLLGGDYGFRDYLLDKKTEFIALDESSTVYTGYAPAGGNVASYCLIQGGNLSKTITTDLGTEELKAFNPSDLAPVLAMSKDERILKYGKGEENLKLTYNDAFRATTMANHATGKVGIGGMFECKDPSGVKLFTAHQKNGTDNIEIWVVEHKPETMVDNVRFTSMVHGGFLGEKREGLSSAIKSDLNAKFPTYESYFDDWYNGFMTKKRKQKLNSNYRFSGAFGFDTKFWLNSSMGALSEVQYFCEAKNGTFIKDGQLFRSFLKQFYMNGGRPVSDQMLNGRYVTSSPFEGKYTCSGANEPFTMELNTYKANTSLQFTLDYALIKKGIDTTPSAPMQPVTNNMNTMNSAVGYNTSTGNSLSSSDEKLIRKATILKVPYGEQQGSNITTALYNGIDAQGCHQVALQKTVANMPVNVAPKNTYNYKVCGTQIMALGETGLPGLPRAKEIAPIITQVKNQCKAYGAYGSEYQGTVVSCRALDQNHCNLEISIMQNGMMVDKRIENSCR